MSETEEFGSQGGPLFRRKFAWADFVRLAGAGAVLPNCREGSLQHHLWFFGRRSRQVLFS